MLLSKLPNLNYQLRTTFVNMQIFQHLTNKGQIHAAELYSVTQLGSVNELNKTLQHCLIKI